MHDMHRPTVCRNWSMRRRRSRCWNLYLWEIGRPVSLYFRIDSYSDNLRTRLTSSPTVILDEFSWCHPYLLTPTYKEIFELAERRWPVRRYWLSFGLLYSRRKRDTTVKFRRNRKVQKETWGEKLGINLGLGRLRSLIHKVNKHSQQRSLMIATLAFLASTCRWPKTGQQQTQF